MPELMIPNDARWTFGFNHANFVRDYALVQSSNHVTCMSYTTFSGRMRNEVRDAAAVAACWWINRIDVDTEYSKRCWCLNNAREWRRLTTADSLDGYTFIAWKEGV